MACPTCGVETRRFVGGDGPDVTAAADEARSIFTRLGASAFLRRLEEAIKVRVS